MSEKIFVELDEEIIFIAEKIRKLEGNKVILVVPERAALLGSVVSLKLLASEIAKIEKSAILVTQDEIGINLSKKANFVAVEKVSDISKDTWEKARKVRKELIESREKEKDQLVSERKEEVKEEEVVDEKQDVEEAVPEEKKVIRQPKKIEPQKVDIEGFEMVAGGDIAAFGEEVSESIPSASLRQEREGAKLASSEIVDKKASEVVEKKEKETKGDVKERVKQRSAVGLVGQDLSSFSYTSVPKQKGGAAKSRTKIDFGKYLDEAITSVKTFFTQGGSRQKVMIGAAVALVVFFLFSYFVLPKGSVVIKVESQDIELDKEVIADTTITALNVEALTIPAQVLEAAKDRSGSVDATGTKETGEHASGQTTLFNVTDSEVSVPSGTVLEAIETGLKYKTTADVTVEAKAPESEGGGLGVVDVGIVAESFGENYNLSKKVEFRVGGFDVENLYGKNFGNITGGTTEHKTVVSQEDYDGLKGTLEGQLKQDLLTSLRNEAGSSKELLEDTVTYEVVNEDPTPEVDSEADTLNLSISMKSTGLSFTKDDIDRLAQVLVEEENEVSIEVEKFEYSSSVTNIEGDKIYINLLIKGVVTPSVNKDDVKTNLAGKGRKAAEEYLNDQAEIKEFKIDLSPKWLPSFLRHFPSSVNRIEVKIEKE